MRDRPAADDTELFLLCTARANCRGSRSFLIRSNPEGFKVCRCILDLVTSLRSDFRDSEVKRKEHNDGRSQRERNRPSERIRVNVPRKGSFSACSAAYHPTSCELVTGSADFRFGGFASSKIISRSVAVSRSVAASSFFFWSCPIGGVRDDKFRGLMLNSALLLPFICSISFRMRSRPVKSIKPPRRDPFSLKMRLGSRRYTLQ